MIKYRIGRREEKQNQMNTCEYCKKDLYDHKKSVVFCDMECAKIWAVDLVAKMDKEEDSYFKNFECHSTIQLGRT